MNNEFFPAGTWEGHDEAANPQPFDTPEPVTPQQASINSTPRINEYKKKVEELQNELKNTKKLLEEKKG